MNSIYAPIGSKHDLHLDSGTETYTVCLVESVYNSLVHICLINLETGIALTSAGMMDWDEFLEYESTGELSIKMWNYISLAYEKNTLWISHSSKPCGVSYV